VIVDLLMSAKMMAGRSPEAYCSEQDLIIHLESSGC